MTEAALLRKIARSEAAAARHNPGTQPHALASNTARRYRRMLACLRATGSASRWSEYEPAA